jgi:hypothetical protein
LKYDSLVSKLLVERGGLPNFFPELASSHDPSHFPFWSSWNYRDVPQLPVLEYNFIIMCIKWPSRKMEMMKESTQQIKYVNKNVCKLERQMWLYIPVIPATQEADIGESLSKSSSGKSMRPI